MTKRDRTLRSGRVRDPVTGGGGAVHFFEDFGCHTHTAAAAGTTAGAHGQLGHGPATTGRGLADLALGDSIAETDIHGGGQVLGTVIIQPQNENDCQF